MEYVVTLIDSISWPATVIILAVFLRKDVGMLIVKLAERLADKNTSFTLSKNGLYVVSQLQAKLESVEEDQEQFKVTQMINENTGKSDPIKLIFEWAKQYREINEKNIRKRTSLKNHIAREMTALAYSYNIDKKVLLSLNDEVVYLAVLGLIHENPNKTDTKIVLEIGEKVGRLHIKYRVLMVLNRLFERGLLTKAEQDEASLLAERYMEGADTQLINKIANFISQMI